MNCPVCTSVSLVMTERSGVEIDYCPKCRGVWLDRGELDKLIDRASAEAPSAPAPHSPAPAPRHGQPPHAPAAHHAPPAGPSHPGYPPGYDPNADSKFGYRYQQPQRKSIWREMFDF
jgi:Zn-finger nucleic acid-binding protein